MLLLEQDFSSVLAEGSTQPHLLLPAGLTAEMGKGHACSAEGDGSAPDGKQGKKLSDLVALYGLLLTVKGGCVL